MEKYVVKDKLMGEMLKRLSVNAKVFLLTNSDWWYSNVSYALPRSLSVASSRAENHDISTG